MHLPQLSSSLGWDLLRGSDVDLVIAAHPSGVLLAAARGPVLTVLPLLPGQASADQQQQPQVPQQVPYNEQARQQYPVHHSKHTYTALEWFVHLQTRRSNPAQLQRHRQQAHMLNAATNRQQHLQQQQQQQQQGGHYNQQQQLQPGQPRCSLEACQSLLQAEVLLAGTADGHLQIHTADGQLLFKQRMFGSAVLDILVRPHCSGLSSSDAGEEVCVCFSNALVCINSFDLRAQIRMLLLVQAGGAAAAGSVSPLQYVRYDLPSAVGPRVSGLSFGVVPSELYTLLSSGAGGSGLNSSLAGPANKAAKHKICIVTVGRNPCLAAFEAEQQPQRSTLAALVGMASSLTSGVVGAAGKVAGLGPSMMYHGVKSLVKPLSSWYYGGSSASSISSSQPIASFDDQQLPKPEALSLIKQLRDDERVLEALVPAPLGALLVAPDNLGRVMLVDGADMAAVRIWKGYRDAQCGWLLPAHGHPAAPLGLLLVLYAPKRQVLEVWLPRSGQRLASRVVDYPCRLLNVGLPCGGWGNEEAWVSWLQQCGSATTLVVNTQTGEVWDALECLLEE